MIELNYLSYKQCSVSKNLKFKTPMFRSDICDYSGSYIVLKVRIITTDTHNDNIKNKKLTFKNNTPIRLCIPKINNTFIDNADVLDFVTSNYNLLWHSGNYSTKSGGLFNQYKDERNDDANENDDINYRVNNKNRTISRSFECKIKITGRIPAGNNSLDTEVVVLLKYLGNFWRSLDF